MRRATPGSDTSDASGGTARQGPATIFDVALVAGVSYATVSRVINGRANVRGETRQRVEAAMRELGYVAHVSARALARGRTQVIGLLAEEVCNAFFTEVIGGVDQEASAQGYDFLLCTTHARREKEAEYVARLSRGMVDGLLIVLPRGLPDYVERLREDAFPFVLIDYDADAPGCSVVNATSRAGTRAAIRHLIELGHRRIALITGRDAVGASHERLAGYQEAMAEAGLPVMPEDIQPGDFLGIGGYAAASLLLSRPDPPTAIFASSDLAAFGVIRAAQERRLRVPEDLSVVGFDDIPEAGWMTPALTTVRQPLREMGRTAVRQLLERLEDPRSSPARLALETELIVRGSTAPPRVTTSAG